MMAGRTGLYVAGGVAVGTAAGLAWVATRGAGPVKLTRFTELRQGPLQEHLVTAEELGVVPVTVRHRYPDRVVPGLTALISHGFAPLWCPPDPQVAALPAEQAW